MSGCVHQCERTYQIFTSMLCLYVTHNRLLATTGREVLKHAILKLHLLVRLTSHEVSDLSVSFFPLLSSLKITWQVQLTFPVYWWKC